MISLVSPCLFKQPKYSSPLWIFIKKPWGFCHAGMTFPKFLSFLCVHQLRVACSSLQWEGWQRISCNSDITFSQSLLLLNKAKPTRFSPALGISTSVYFPRSTFSPSHWRVCGPASVLLCSWIKHKALFGGYSFSHFKKMGVGSEN